MVEIEVGEELESFSWVGEKTGNAIETVGRREDCISGI